MFPAIFTIFSDLLSRLLSRVADEGKISGVKVFRLNPKITHLMYADDLVIYCKANTLEATEVTNCLQTYCNWTGQEINWGKSSVHFSGNVHRQSKGKILRIMNIQECQQKGKYLGHPFCQMKSKTEAYMEVLEKLQSKLTG